MKRLAIIPARGGSKRIPRKNIKNFLGKPIMQYSIEVALNSNLFDEIMVSTDDDDVMQVALNCGAKVPFLRSQNSSDDHATLSDVIKEVINKYEQNNVTFQQICCLLPTAPFITIHNLKIAYNLMVKRSYNTVFPVKSFPHPIQRALRIDKNTGKVSMVWPENLNIRSQDLTPTYHDCGQFYWMNTASFLEEGKIYSSNSGVIILPEIEVQDIDTEEDWKNAEIKFKILKTCDK